ncbi:BlaI/MecI/CopY family transcriptional regulator [Actinomadura parmotrematis]|uniref:BlaI/MecI/CopY family transcriptional regulator n=1 Tax=Actinomadura parmotrematis TaxID=2864039 RepID=A0ABS7FN85_9ACTN|nr:BlaI/MecI/CopY family transcriptional regulator [Actinomadura parmotrematis]MBW8481835.1 BlaI/MecI/CopY family transcriptional regulator [Actinomadura parmotrematis]
MGEGTSSRRPWGALEAELLAVLQAADGPLSPGEAAARLDGRAGYSTVVTALTRLHAKGTLNRERRGRAYIYSPVLDAAGTAARRMRQLLEREQDRDAVLMRFVDELSPQDEALFRRLLADDGPA